MKRISLVFNLYLPKKDLLETILQRLEDQKTSHGIDLIIVDKKIDDSSKKLIKQIVTGSKKIKLEIIKVDEHISFASSMNAGIHHAKQEIVVILQQDCIPLDSQWLENLIKPFEDKQVVATVSKVQFPQELWKPLDAFTKSLLIREQGTITPLLDEKGCAYRKSTLLSLGAFNDKDFQTAGEDFDIYIKLKQKGRIAYPDATIIHQHPTDFTTRLKKVKQYANGFGTLVKMHRKKMPHWHIGLLKATPLLGIPLFLMSYPFEKGIALYPAHVLLTPLVHFLYIQGFWKGFFTGHQSIDIFPQK